MCKLSETPIIKIALVCFMIFSMSGCLLTESFKQNAKEQNEMNIAKKKLADIKEIYTAQELTKKLQELERLQPDINRVIALEGDLAYLTELIKSEAAFGAQGIKGEAELPSLNSIISSDINLMDMAISDTEQASKLASNAPNLKLNNGVQVGVAPSYLPSLTKDTNLAASNDTISIDDKFKGHSFLSSAKEGLGSSVQLNKAIQGDDLSSKSVSENGCFEPGSKNGTYSVHLASYKSKTNALSGWKKLFSKHQNLLCKLSPKLVDVTVNGQQFLSLRAGPLNDRPTALNLCSAIKAEGDYCGSAAFVGSPLYGSLNE